MNSLVYRTLFYVNIYGSYYFKKQSYYWPTLYKFPVRKKKKSTAAKYIGLPGQPMLDREA